MKLLSYLIPQVLFNASTKFNKKIKVLEVNGKNRLYVNGILQTGPYDESIFRSAFTYFGLNERQNVHSILMLGLGGGFVADLMHGQYPNAHITCVDIDSEMVGIAKRYFGLQKISAITYIVSDAEKYVQEAPKNEYDLVVIDLFIGDSIPQFVEKPDFLAALHRLMHPNSALLVNYQAYQTYAIRRAQLHKNLSLLFSRVMIKNIRRNCFICAEV
jgi:spermidine synthase